MAIDITREELIPLADAPAILPKRHGKKINLSTIYRWAQRGLKGVRLEIVQYGGTKATTREALNRFFQRLTAQESGSDISSIRTPARRQREIERAERDLEEAGI